MHHRAVQHPVVVHSRILGTLAVAALAGLLGCADTSGPPVGDLGAAGAGEPAPGAADESGPSAGTTATSDLAVSGQTEPTAGAGNAGSEFGAAGEGSAGTEAAAGAAGGLEDAGAGGPEKPQCLQKDSQVVVVGDSYINWVSHTMMQDLKTVSGQNWRNYAVGAASMGSGGLSFIPDQFDTAIAEDPDMTVVVMDGGGNDILVASPDFPGGADCKNRQDAPSVPVCQQIVQLAIDTAEDLMDRAVDQGVKDVIYFFYPEVPEGTLIGGTHPRAILNYALPLVRETCTGAEVRTGGKLKCHFIDTIPLFKGHDDWFAPTDIHENSLGSMAITKEIWRVMQENCIAQKSPSTCCAP